jgi:hypothetical protein
MKSSKLGLVASAAEGEGVRALPLEGRGPCGCAAATLESAGGGGMDGGDGRAGASDGAGGLRSGLS